MATRLAPLLLPHGKCTQAHEHTRLHCCCHHRAVSVTHTAGRFSFPLNYKGFSAKGWRKTERGVNMAYDSVAVRRRTPSAMFGKGMTFDTWDSPLVSPTLLLYSSDYENIKALRKSSFSKSESDLDLSAFALVCCLNIWKVDYPIW